MPGNATCWVTAGIGDCSKITPASNLQASTLRVKLPPLVLAEETDKVIELSAELQQTDPKRNSDAAQA
jgi:hypothetical protein